MYKVVEIDSTQDERHIVKSIRIGNYKIAAVVDNLGEATKAVKQLRDKNRLSFYVKGGHD